MRDKSTIAPDAIRSPKSFYNSRFRTGYMRTFDYDIYEVCRLYTLRQILKRMKSKGVHPSSILDYGCGQGRYVNELSTIFPEARLHGCDISDTGLQIAQRRCPEATFHTMDSELVPCLDKAFELVISVEVLEHVQCVEKAVCEIARVLKPGGTAVVTTPCANRYSFEWFVNRIRGGLLPSADGYGRFATDEPSHLRRLNDSHLMQLFAKYSVQIGKIYHRGHLFTMPAQRLRSKALLPAPVLVWLAMLDWRLFKHLSNGSTMLAIGTKT